VIYGGDNFADAQLLAGGYGDDKLIGGHGLAAEDQKIYGDHVPATFPATDSQ